MKAQRLFNMFHDTDPDAEVFVYLEGVEIPVAFAEYVAIPEPKVVLRLDRLTLLRFLETQRIRASGFQCPNCGRVTHHPEHKRQGYCGACKAFTGEAGRI